MPTTSTATVQLRHLAMAHALHAALPEDPLWADPLAATEGAVDVKEALKRAVTGQLEVRTCELAAATTAGMATTHGSALCLVSESVQSQRLVC